MTVEELHRQLFNTEYDVYAVIDGAAVPALLAKLEEFEPEHTCLFRGELPFDLAEAAPYLVRLTPDNNFSQWLVEIAKEQPCCIFAYSKEKFTTLRMNLRSLLKAQLPDGKIMHFRYYDPRVLNSYLKECKNESGNFTFHKHVDVYLSINVNNSFSYSKIRQK